MIRITRELGKEKRKKKFSSFDTDRFLILHPQFFSLGFRRGRGKKERGRVFLPVKTFRNISSFLWNLATMSADAMDISSTPSLFDSDGLYDDNYLDNLSIDIWDLYAILDEEPQQPNTNNTTNFTVSYLFFYRLHWNCDDPSSCYYPFFFIFYVLPYIT